MPSNGFTGGVRRTRAQADIKEIARLRAEVAQRDQRVRNMQLVEADVRAEYLRFEQRALRAEAEVARLTRAEGMERAKRQATETLMRDACERYEALRACVTQLVGALREVERHCPCGARAESLGTHSHVTGCSVSAALAAAEKVLP